MDCFISTKSWRTGHVRQQQCLCVQKDFWRTAMSGCKEGKSGGQVPQPADKVISQEAMIHKNCPNCVVMPIRLSPSTPMHSEWDEKRQLYQLWDQCLPVHSCSTPCFSKWCSEKVPDIQDKDRSTGDVSDFCTLYSMYHCYGRFSWPEDYSQLKMNLNLAGIKACTWYLTSNRSFTRRTSSSPFSLVCLQHSLLRLHPWWLDRRKQGTGLCEVRQPVGVEEGGKWKNI